jgi:hypothetical protein
MRQLIITAIINHNLQNRDYGDYIQGSHDAKERHDQICSGLHRMTDDMLLAVYQRTLLDNPVLIVNVDKDGKYADIYLPRIKYYGGMIADGSIHT